MKRPYKYKNYKFFIKKLKNGYFTLHPLNFTTQAIILEASKSGCYDAIRKYLDRILHYNT